MKREVEVQDGLDVLWAVYELLFKLRAIGDDYVQMTGPTSIKQDEAFVNKMLVLNN